MIRRLQIAATTRTPAEEAYRPLTDLRKKPYVAIDATVTVFKK